MRTTLTLCVSVLALSLALTFATENWKTHNDQLRKVLNNAIYQLWISGNISEFYQRWFNVQCRYQPPCYDDREYIPKEDAKGILYQILSTQKIRFCADIKKPILFYDGNAQFTGVENDLMIALTQELSREYDMSITGEWIIKETTSFFDNMTTALNNNECDAILSFVSFNMNRSLVADFTCMYAPLSAISLIRGTYRPDMTFSSLSDLNNPNWTVGFREGTVYETLYKKYMPKATKLILNAFPDRGYSKLDAAHVIIDDLQNIYYFLLQNPNSSAYTSPSWNFPEATDWIEIVVRKIPQIVPK